MSVSLHSRLASVKHLLALATLATTVACNLDNSVASGTPVGYVQFIDAAPRYATADFYIGSTLSLGDQFYGVDTLYVYAPVSTTPLTFTARMTNDTTVIATNQSPVQANGIYTVVLTQHTTKGGLLIFPNIASTPSGNQAAIRLVNVAPGVPSPGTVDVYVTLPTVTDISTVTPSVSNVAFEAASSYIAFLPTSAGIRVRVTTAGTKTVLVDINSQIMQPGEVRTVFLLDDAGGGAPFQSLVIEDLL